MTQINRADLAEIVRLLVKHLHLVLIDIEELGNTNIADQTRVHLLTAGVWQLMGVLIVRRAEVLRYYLGLDGQ